MRPPKPHERLLVTMLSMAVTHGIIKWNERRQAKKPVITETVTEGNETHITVSDIEKFRRRYGANNPHLN